MSMLSTDRESLWNLVNLLTDAMEQSISMKSCKSFDKCNEIMHLYVIILIFQQIYWNSTSVSNTVYLSADAIEQSIL